MVDFQTFTFQELLQLKVELEVELKKREQEEKAAAPSTCLFCGAAFVMPASQKHAECRFCGLNRPDNPLH